MKTKILFFTLLLLSLNAVAGNPVRFGIILGPNYKSFTGIGDASSLSEFHIGGTAEIPIFTENTYLNPSIQIQVPVGHSLDVQNISDFSVNLPLFLEYKKPINDKISPFISAGAIFSIVGYCSHHNDDGSCVLKSPFDFAIGINAGIELSRHYQLSVGYDYGIINISNYSDITAHSGNLKLSFAYFFGKKNKK